MNIYVETQELSTMCLMLDGEIQEMVKSCVRRSRSGGDLLDVFPYPVLEQDSLDAWARRGMPFNFRQYRSALLTRLNTMARMLSRETQPRVLSVLSRTVAKVDSIGLVVRR